jgi:hypothetical protein
MRDAGAELHCGGEVFGRRSSVVGLFPQWPVSPVRGRYRRKRVVTAGRGGYYHCWTMKHASRIALSVVLVGVLGAGVCAADSAVEARAEARQAISDLVGELQRRESEVVKARAAQEALSVEVENLREALSEAEGKSVSGATATRELAARTATETELAQLRKQVDELTTARDGAVAET